MVSIEQAIADLENAELKPVNENKSITTTSSEIIIFLRLLQNKKLLLDELLRERTEETIKKYIVSYHMDLAERLSGNLDLFCESCAYEYLKIDSLSCLMEVDNATIDKIISKYNPFMN